MAEWQDISTAPRHGDLLLHNVAGGWTKVGRFYSTSNDQSLWFKSDYGSHLKPTHWQPLPEPPVIHAPDCMVHVTRDFPFPCSCGALPTATTAQGSAL